MSQSETDIHLIVLRLLREGYAALSAAQRRVVDSLMAVCCGAWRRRCGRLARPVRT